MEDKLNRRQPQWTPLMEDDLFGRGSKWNAKRTLIEDDLNVRQ